MSDTRIHGRWRPDIQGLRGVAVLAVVLFHTGAPVSRGGFVGVDVFFVISGFLITGNLLREHRASGSVRLVPFFRHRVVRLAPTAVAVVAATLVVSRLVLPPLDLVELRTDALSSLLGVQNVRLALQGTDYLAPHEDGPFQQFWSLGVEEQFYLGWAILLAIVLAIRQLRRWLPAIVLVLTSASFTAMTILAGISGPWTFFSPVTRTWELGVGAAVAIWAARSAAQGSRTSGTLRCVLRRTRPFRAPAGLAAIIAAVLLIDPATPFPGPATLVPVLGTALLVAPAAPGYDPVRRVITSAPLRWAGDRSYSIYLWHWPALVLPARSLGRALDPAETAVALVVVVALSWVGHALLERRVGTWGRSRPERPLAIVAATAALLVVVPALTALPALHGSTSVPSPTATQVTAGPWSPRTVPSDVTPGIAGADADLPDVYDNGCHADFAAVDAEGCRTGHGDRTIVLFGDSHAAQWVTPLRSIARDHGAVLQTITKSSCPSATLEVRAAELGRGYRECDAWREDALDRIDVGHPDLVVLANAANSYRDGTTATEWEQALRTTIERVQTSGARVLVLGDTPKWTSAPNRCLSASVEDVADCAAPTRTLVDRERTDAQERAAAAADAVFADPVPWLCDTRCAPVLWNVLVYRDTNHLTDAMAATLRPRLEPVVAAALAPSVSP